MRLGSNGDSGTRLVSSRIVRNGLSGYATVFTTAQMRTVSENARTLKFDQSGFEES